MTEDIIARIDEAIDCQFCKMALKPNGPSPDFCSESCQQAWHAKRVRKAWCGLPAGQVFTASEIATWYGVPTAMLEPRPSPEPDVAASTAEDLEITITMDTSALDRAMLRASWLSRWIRRHR